MAGNAKPMMLYIHLPFCVRKCHYCDFLSGPQYAKGPYLAALQQEIAAAGEACREYEVSSIFFGGGTPTLLSGEEWEALTGAVREHFVVREDAEITSESNPGTVSLELLSTMRKLGVNRLSIGLQSAREEELRLLGRIHSYEEFLEAFGWAREAGFDNINVELIGALPGQSLEECLSSVRTVAELGPEHISA